MKGEVTRWGTITFFVILTSYFLRKCIPSVSGVDRCGKNEIKVREKKCERLQRTVHGKVKVSRVIKQGQVRSEIVGRSGRA